MVSGPRFHTSVRQLVIAIMPMRLSGSTIRLLTYDEGVRQAHAGVVGSGPHEALRGTVVAHHALLREAALAEREPEALQRSETLSRHSCAKQCRTHGGCFSLRHFCSFCTVIIISSVSGLRIERPRN